MIKLSFHFSRIAVVCFVVLTAVLGCVNNNIITFETRKINQAKWFYKDTIVFKANISEIVSYYDLSVNLRNSGDYQYSNFYTFLTIQQPDGKRTVDTIELIVADEKGRWLGKGLGGSKDNFFTFQKGIRFPQPGQYTFKFVQAMRIMNLKGITDFGLRIDKEKN